VVKSQKGGFGFVPILGALYERVLELTAEFEGKEYHSREWTGHRMKINQEHTGDGIMSALNDNYYWSPGRQRKFEQVLSDMKLGDPYPTWVEQLLLDRDTDGVKVTYSR